MDPNHPLNIRVEQAFAAWRERRQLLQAGSQALEQELEKFAHGERADPTELKAYVEELRAQCDRLFLEVLEAVRVADAAGVR